MGFSGGADGAGGVSAVAVVSGALGGVACGAGAGLLQADASTTIVSASVSVQKRKGVFLWDMMAPPVLKPWKLTSVQHMLLHALSSIANEALWAQ